ncbi:plasmid replication protein, CyRepA1 family [Leptolyngbya ohadii]|uniref:plasmid replication protein, CyRepA1 family n=1 Tax=Leptolyngbya ohadii TaxID=1962290 RepID=UPI000B59864E|nr:plasmid replication protein, CyRepA1 family [Leptolyngbya ohadii]
MTTLLTPSKTTPDRPSHITQAHWDEWVIGSQVDPEIVAMNVRSVEDVEIDPYTHEVTTPIHDLLNWKFTRFGHRVKASLRGWLVSGVEGWVRFKPDADTPIYGKDGKPAKYLGPKGEQSRLILLDVPLHIWKAIANRYDAPMPLAPERTTFWQWVIEQNIPVIPIEGEKKAGTLLTLGYAAIALPGITGGVRTRDEHQNPLSHPYLLPDLKPFATPKRQVYICFDYEPRQKQLIELNREIAKLSEHFSKGKCAVKVIQLPGKEKGVDDFVVAQGAEAFHRLYSSALSTELWQASRLSKLSHPADLTLNQRYLGKLPIPGSAKLIILKSPKGTGKTESFVEIVAEATRNGQPVLLISHRVQLAQAICERIGIPYVSEVRSFEGGMMLGFGVCIDSLHSESQARFNAEAWNDVLVIVDECEQVIWHALSATTEVKNHRIPILQSLKTLLCNVVESANGKIILADADVSDLSIEFIWGLLEQKIQPWIAVNEWQPNEPWTIHNYTHKSPEQWFAALTRHLETAEGATYVTTQSQKPKSRWSTRTLESLFSRRFPNKRILRIDSETIVDPGHPAYNCTSHLNEVLPNYDLVLVSPSIETGVSIDIRGHFTSVWGCFQGVCPENSARQALARVREPVDRHIWATRYGFSKEGNGSASVRSILAAEYQVAKISQQLVQVISYDEEAIATYATSLKIWAKMAARINAGRLHYRETILHNLQREGHLIKEVNQIGETLELVGELQAVRDEQYLKEREATASADGITANQYEELKGKKTKTPEELHKQRKHELHTRYQVEVTPELVEKDDDGWYPRLRLYYFLTIGRCFLQGRDKQTLENIVQTSGLWLPTMNRSQYTTKIQVLEALALRTLLNPDAEFNGGTKAQEYENAHPLLYDLAAKAKRFAWQIKTFLGVSISESMSPIQIAQSLLGKLGIKLTCDRQEGGKGNRQRIYRFLLPKDGRDEILSGWFHRDEVTRNQSEMHTPGKYIETAVGGSAA